MFEMMSQGVPIVAANNHGVRELLEENDVEFGVLLNNFSANSDVDDWAEYIKSTIDNPDELVRLGNMAKQRVNMFNKEQTINSWLGLIST